MVLGRDAGEVLLADSTSVVDNFKSIFTMIFDFDLDNLCSSIDSVFYQLLDGDRKVQDDLRRAYFVN